jgi:Fic family protein
MTALLEWTNRQFGEKKIHPLLVIATFIYEFLSIHPFQDGNGRLSRLLTTLLLLQHGYGFVQYVSFENLIEERKKDYYLALMDGQKNRYQEEESIEKWVVFFLSGLETLLQRLENKQRQFDAVNHFLNERQQKLIDIISEKKLVQIAMLLPLFPGVSQSTIKNDLGLLVERQLLVRVGGGRGVRYFIPAQE